MKFPNDPHPEKNDKVYKSESVIRLLTRLIFIWFIKEKGLVPNKLFDREKLNNIIKDFNNKSSHNYYNAILQNLFFATLNKKMSEREFAVDATGKKNEINKNKKHYGVKNLFRYADLFQISQDEVLKIFQNVPFLNGGLFDCLDKENVNENNKVLYADGFSRNPKKQAKVPDELFFTNKENNEAEKGLIDIFNHYKFTITENTPIEEEVALDPELLGKVFENLLATYNPETKENARKQTGSFYTPREIVDYMVDESLLGYFKSSGLLEENLRKLFSYSQESNPFNEEDSKRIIEAINNCKILDPACGSGAFPMGVLHRLVYLLSKLDTKNKIWKETQREAIIGAEVKKLREDQKKIEELADDRLRERALVAVEDRLKEIDKVFDESYNFDDYARKLYLIENCIFGIDIQPIAVQISKLRFFISLVIDQKVATSGKIDNRGIRPLPNLETKFVAGNTLIGLEKPEKQIVISNPDIEVIKKELKELRHKYFTASNRENKLKYQKNDNDLRKKLTNLLKKDGWDTSVAEKISVFDPYDQNAPAATWFDPEWMFGLDRDFDIVIGNPPYVQIQKFARSQTQENLKNQNFQTFEKTGDIYALFYEKGLKILKEKTGLLCLITSNKWMRTGYGKRLREYFINKNPLLLIDLGGDVFGSATVDTNILLIENNFNQKKTKALTIKNNKENISLQVQEDSIPIAFENNEGWFIGNASEIALKNKIEKLGKPLKDWDVKIYRGVLTGLNEAFIINEETRNKLIAEDAKSAEIIKPILRGRDIKRYGYEWAGLYILATGYDIDIPKLYPAIYKHLLQFKKKAEARDDQGLNWYNLRACAYYPEFEKEKVVYPNMTKYLPFIFDDKSFYVNQKCFILTGKNLKFITGYLNSFISHIWIRQNCPELQGGTRELSKVFFENIPIPPITPANSSLVKKIESIVEQILNLKKSKPTADTIALEKEIDELVYKLYELSPEEIEIVEKSVRR